MPNHKMGTTEQFILSSKKTVYLMNSQLIAIA